MLRASLVLVVASAVPAAGCKRPDGPAREHHASEEDTMDESVPENVKLEVAARVEEGYGSALAAAPGGDTWAASLGTQLYIHKDRSVAREVHTSPFPAAGLRFSADGDRLFAGPTTVKIAGGDLEVAPEVKERTSGYTIDAAARAPDGSFLVVSLRRRVPRDPRRAPHSASGKVERLLVFSGDGVRDLTAEVGESVPMLTPVAASNDWIAVYGDTLDVLRAGDLQRVARIERPTRSVRVLTFDPSGSLLVGAGAGPKITAWSTSSWKESASWDAHDSRVTALAFTAGGGLLASGGKDQKIKVWRLAGGKATLAGELAVDGDVDALAFGKDRLYAAIRPSAPPYVLLIDLGR